ncbi:MAG: M14 family metallopeptidase [Candidatus Cloacimonetes bacterium]|nr:M14 family metallopeptidase [Candidatus Cloacimonadota bacterium]MDD2649793.1 M14 family metallopeptidase [Candidatus Cloacimonadota bacterium]MDD3502049.1 M14 family metallopeptidase [Candidatus Cloacimonadota bacterium]
MYRINRKISLISFIILFYVITLAAYSNKYPLDSNYHRTKDIENSIKKWEIEYPNVFYSEILGYTGKDKMPIRSFKISFDPKVKSFDKPSILIIGQIHASEPLGVEICMRFADYLLQNYQNNERVKSLLRSFSFHFIPTINPEGFEVVSSGIYANHRKNKTDINSNNRFDRGIDGVDINRNFPLNWNNETQKLPHDPHYAGESPASEKETQAIIDFMKRERFYLAINYHSSYFGDLNERIFFPWNWSGAKSPHWYEMKAIASIISKNLKKDYSSANYLVHTGNTTKVGFLRDWSYAETGTFFFDIEVGGIYKNKSIIFPDNANMHIIVDKNIKALINSFEYLDINTSIVKIIDSKGKPYILSKVHYNTLKQDIVKPLLSNEKGLLFIFWPPDRKQLNLYINDRKYLIKKSKSKNIIIKLIN